MSISSLYIHHLFVEIFLVTIGYFCNCISAPSRTRIMQSLKFNYDQDCCSSLVPIEFYRPEKHISTNMFIYLRLERMSLQIFL